MLIITLALTAIAFAVPAPATRVVPCVMQHHVIVCPVDVGLSEPLAFVIDTGTRRTVIDLAVAAGLGLASTASSVIALGNNVLSGDAAMPSLRFGSLSLNGLRVSACDLRALEASMGVKAAGILGMDVLGRTSLTIDYRRARVTIGAFGALAHSVPLVRTAGDFGAVDVEIDGQRLRLVIDTGAAGLMLFAPHGLTASIPGGWVNAGGLWGSSRLATLRVRELRIATWPLQGQSVAYAEAPQAMLAYDSDGLLGVRSLDAGLVSLDFAHGELRWQR